MVWLILSPTKEGVVGSCPCLHVASVNSSKCLHFPVVMCVEVFRTEAHNYDYVICWKNLACLECLRISHLLISDTERKEKQLRRGRTATPNCRDSPKVLMRGYRLIRLKNERQVLSSSSISPNFEIFITHYMPSWLNNIQSCQYYGTLKQYPVASNPMTAI